MRTIRYFAPVVAVLALVALAIPSLASAASSATVPTRQLPASGGTVEWTATVRNAQWCEWSSSPAVTGFDATVRCKTGTVTRLARFKPNASARVLDYTLSLTVLGRTKAVAYLKVVEAPRTMASGSTTVDCSPSSYCLAQFPAPDDFGIVSFKSSAVMENMLCPVRGACHPPAGDQLDLILIVMATGTRAITDPSREERNISLILAGGSQAHMDSASCDVSVQYNLCRYFYEGPETGLVADIWFDAPIGSTCSSIHFRYRSGKTSIVYIFPAAYLVTT